MKILYLTLEPPLDPALVVRGNAIRASRLIDALGRRGAEVTHVWRAPYDRSRVGAHPSMYQDRGQLASIVESVGPDAIVAGYWNLVPDLPPTGPPVIVDFIAPRMLEALFEDAEVRDTELLLLLRALERAAGFIVANERQEHLLIPYLLMAGHDLRSHRPIARVPIAAPRPLPAPASPPPGRVTFVGGGVEWPWRRHRRWLDTAADQIRRHASSARLIEFGGEYPRIVEPPDGVLEVPADDAVCRLALASYAEYSRFLSDYAHVGLELADENVERYFSHSFRLVDYLSHGLPVVCNRYLPAADRIECHDAGWTVGDDAELRHAIDEAAGRPDLWQRKHAGALRLADEELNPDRVIEPLVGLLEKLLDESSWNGRDPAFSTLADEEREEFDRLRREVAGWEGEKNEYRRTIESLREQVAELHDRNLALSLQAPRAPGPGPKAILRQAVRGFVRKLPKPGAGQAPGNVVVITRSDLFPTDHGGAVKIVETARALSHTGREVAIVTDRRDIWWSYRSGERREHRFPKWLGLAGMPPGANELFHLDYGFPLSNAFLYQPFADISYLWRALYVARRLDANVYQAEFPAFALPCLRLRSVRGGRVVVVEHNVEYERLREQEPDLSREQYLHLKDIEIGLCNQADAVICVSENDRRRLAADGIVEELLHYVPHGVSLASFDGSEPRRIRDELDWEERTRILVYHGTYEYPPNLEAVRVCAREVLPRLARRGVDARLLAIGGHAPAGDVHPGVRFIGGVEAIAGWLRGAEVAVVPLTSGGGTRMKILDYFAAQVPVVSTSKGIEGIPVTPGREAFVEDDWDAFCDRVEELLTEPGRSARMAADARAFVEPLDWSRIADRYLSIFGMC